MKLNVAKEVTALGQLTLSELRAKYAERYGAVMRAGNRVTLVRRIIWRLQAQAEGGLSERARQRALELANDADLRLLPPVPPRAPRPTPLPAPRLEPTPKVGHKNEGMPLPGTVLTRVYKGATLQVRVLHEGFAFEGTVFSSLSALAQAITGAHWNGRLFFGLRRKAGAP
jgi:Protein of unknown function (DUF2924)